PLSNLVGCPTNGVWTLTVIDNWAADDGTLFSFGLNLDPSYYPPISTFEPQIGLQCDSSFWINPQFQSSITPDCNELTVTPTAAGSFTYTYSVTDDFGCSYDTSLVLTVEDLASVFAGNDTTLCDGAALQLDGQIAGAQSSCDYNLLLEDTFGDGWNGNNMTITVNGNGTNYTLTTGSSTTFPLSIPSGASVTVTFNANGSWVEECEFTILDDQGNVVLNQGPGLFGPTNDVFSANCSPDYVYSWTPASAVSDPSIPDPVLTVNGQQNLTLSVYPIGHPLCASTDDILVSISATPNPGADNQLEVCSSGNPVDLFPLLGPGASTNGSWLDPSGNPINMPYDPVTMPIGIYTYFVDSNGCTDQAIITITEIITDITGITTTNPTCFGFSDGFVTVTGNNIDSYSLNGAAQVNASSPFDITGLSSGNYTLEVFSVDGCSAIQNFVLADPPALSASAVETPASCFGTCDAEIQISVLGGTPGYSYNWNGQTGDQNGFGNGLCAGSYTVTVTDAQACVLDVPYTITQPANVTPEIMGDVLSGCYPHTVNFMNTTGSGNIATTYVDYGDGSSELIQGENPFSHEYANPGIYTVSIVLTTLDNCIYSATYNNYITVFDDPIANFVINPNNVSMLEPIVNLIDQSTQDVSLWNWTIYGGNPATSSNQNVNNVTYPFDSPGNYLVSLYVENDFGCWDSIQKEVVIISDILLYAPNTFTPDNDEFNQNWEFFISGIDIYDFDLFIFNRWGEIIWESHDPSVGWDGTYNGQIVPQGTYTWTMQVADGFNDDKYTFNGHINIIR
ncbi:MAG: T9SS type B sorting domain-containing protein, partial [Bacteroidetes bacterium]